MKSVILMGGLGLFAFSASAQMTGRAKQSSLPLGVANRTAVSYNRNVSSLNQIDTTTVYLRNAGTPTASVMGSPTALRFSDIQAQCDQNAMVLSWEAIQQFNAGRYEVEQSDDQRNWRVIGVVPANRTEFGRSNYNFTYNQNTGSSLFRITAVTTGEERVYSALIESPCSNTSYLAVTPNPVYNSTTVRIGSPATARVKLVLFNSAGAAMQQREATLQSGINHVPLDMGSLPRGAYSLMIIWSNGKQESLQLIKQ